MTELERKQDRAPIPADWAYAPAPESREIVTLEDRYGLFVGGEWVEPKSGEYEATISPATEEPLAEVAYAGPEDVGVAVDSARAADRMRERLWLEDHARPAAVRRVVDGAVPVGRPAAQVVDPHVQQAVGARLADQ